MTALWIWVGGALGVLTVLNNDDKNPPMDWWDPLLALTWPITATVLVYRYVKGKIHARQK